MVATTQLVGNNITVSNPYENEKSPMGIDYSETFTKTCERRGRSKFYVILKNN